jgi:hypothetical protein
LKEQIVGLQDDLNEKVGIVQLTNHSYKI